MANTCGRFVRICLSTGMMPRSLTSMSAALETDALAVGGAADGHEHAVEGIRAFAVGVFELDREAFRLRRAARDLGVEQDLLVTRLEALLERPTRSASAPGMSWPVSSTTESFAPSAAYTVAISRPMMPPPMTSRRLRHAAQLQRAGGIDDARVVGDER